MQSSLGLQLSRSLRSHRPLPFIRVSSVSMAEMVAESAKEKSYVPVYTMTGVPDIDIAFLKQWGGEVLVECLGNDAASLQTAHDYKVGGLCLQGVSQDGYPAIVKKMQKEGTEVIASMAERSLKHGFSAHDAVAVRLSDDAALTASSLKDLVKLVKVPLIISAESRSAQGWKEWSKVGVAGLWFDKMAPQAYTAGLRTALRNREVWDPAKYERTAVKAVHSALQYLFSSI